MENYSATPARSNRDVELRCIDLASDYYPRVPRTWRKPEWDDTSWKEILKETGVEFDLNHRRDLRPLRQVLPEIFSGGVRWFEKKRDARQRVAEADAQQRLEEEARRAALTPEELVLDDARIAARKAEIRRIFNSQLHCFGDKPSDRTGKFDEDEPEDPSDDARNVTNAEFRDDAPLEWAMQDREFDWDWFNERPGTHFRLTSAFKGEATTAGVLPLKPQQVALRLTRFGPSDAIPVSRVLVVAADDVARISAATPAELQALWTFETAETIVPVQRGSAPASTEFDQRGKHSPLNITRNPVLPAAIRPKVTPKPFADRTYTIDFTEEDVPKLEKRQWLVEGFLSPRVATMIVAEGAAGKSLYSLQLAIALARGDGDFMGVRVLKRTKVLIVNMEDEPVDQRARVAAICKHFGLSLAGLRGWLHVYNPIDGLIRLVVQGRQGLEEGPDVASIDQYVADNEIGAVVFDPLVEMRTGGSESDNDTMNFTVGVIKDSARRLNYAPLIIHHTSKPSQAGSKGFAGNPHTARGGSATVNATRLTCTMCRMSKEDAAEKGVPAHTMHRYVRLDDAKTNNTEMARPRWLQKVSVTLGNGTTSVAMEPVFLETSDRSRQCREIAERLMLAAIDAGVHLSPKKQARDKYAGRYLEMHQGPGNCFSSDDFAREIGNLCGFAFRLQTYDNKKGNKEAQRYVR